MMMIQLVIHQLLFTFNIHNVALLVVRLPLGGYLLTAQNAIQNLSMMQKKVRAINVNLTNGEHFATTLVLE